MLLATIMVIVFKATTFTNKVCYISYDSFG